MKMVVNTNVKIEFVTAGIDGAPRSGTDYAVDVTDAVVWHIQRPRQLHPEVGIRERVLRLEAGIDIDLFSVQCHVYTLTEIYVFFDLSI